MRVIRNGKCVKIVPIKFEHVLDGFEFESESKRLSPNERHLLILRLVRKHFDVIGENYNVQRELACTTIWSCNDIKIVKVNKHGGNPDWRILADSMEFRVPSEIVSDCPREFLKIKHEF